MCNLRCKVIDSGVVLDFLALQPVAQRVVVTALEAQFLSLPLAGLDHVVQTHQPSDDRFAADDASLIPAHPQLIPPLPGNLKLCELILNGLSHYSSRRSLSQWPPSPNGANQLKGLFEQGDELFHGRG